MPCGQQLRPQRHTPQRLASNAPARCLLACNPRSLHGLKLLLNRELDALEAARAAAAGKLSALDRACLAPSGELVRQAGDCGRCRAELGVRGQLWVPALGAPRPLAPLPASPLLICVQRGQHASTAPEPRRG
jgi:hypothetical protein